MLSLLSSENKHYHDCSMLFLISSGVTLKATLPYLMWKLNIQLCVSDTCEIVNLELKNPDSGCFVVPKGTMLTIEKIHLEMSLFT